MASVETLPSAASKASTDPSSVRREQELQAGRLKLEQFKQKRKGKKANARATTPAEPRFSHDEQQSTPQQVDEQPAACLDLKLHGPGSQNGFSVQNGETAKKAGSSIFQGRAQGLKQAEQTFSSSDSRVGTEDIEKPGSGDVDQDSGLVPICKPDGNQGGAEDLPKFLQHSSNNNVPKESMEDANTSVSMLLPSGHEHSRVVNGVTDDISWSSTSSLTKLMSGQVLDVPDPGLLPSLAGVTAKIENSSTGERIASISLSDWSTVSRPFMTPLSTVATDGPDSEYGYGYGSVSQPSVSKPQPSASPFLPHSEYQSIADPEIKVNSYFVSPSVESSHTSPPKSRPLTGTSTFSFTNSPLRPLSATTAAQLESSRSLVPKELWSTPFSDSSSTSIFEPHSLTSLPTSKSYFEASRPTSFVSKALPLSKSAFTSFASSNHVSSRPLHSSFLEPISSQATIVSTGGHQEHGVGISEGREEQLMDFLPRLPPISFLDQDMEKSRKSEREEFLSLEQHIEDLTQEKFSLQRSLDKERAMAASLASENTALVEDFNNQGQVVQRLKDDIVALEENVRMQEAMVKSMRAEREKAQQESSSAIERSQTLAGEVIALENRVRTLRSHELRLERDMESLTSDVDSYKRQIASLDKDRTHWKTMVDALQEEKKLLQGHLRKAALGDDTRKRETPLAAQQRQLVLADASTSTDDLVTEIPTLVGHGSSFPSDSRLVGSWQNGQQPDRSMGQSLGVGIHPFVHFHGVSSSMPPEVLRTVNNINAVITSLGEEKKAMLKALKAESKAAAQLRALNSDLSQKLEAQTQQLELAVAQRMAHGSRVSVQVAPKPGIVATDFVDEGDEVVDRVLGWIMHLFPGGSSRRNGVKRL
ncbi:unnamed protein product [Sphagnum jensenii]|uniref:Uncharacterized protein n=1 Tax=Sphagnum jensenii TaxID=128206 RepID=A0ABP0WUV6_9BRYO